MKIFKWCPEIALKRCLEWFEPNHVHICIRSLGREVVKPNCDGQAMFLAFHDIGDNAPEEYKDGLFTEAHAKSIVEFVNSTPNEKLIVVNCEAGISRSAGVVLAMRRHFGGDTEEVYKKAMPNILVTSLVSRVLGGQI